MNAIVCDRCATVLPSNHRTERTVHREKTDELSIEVLLYAETRIREDDLFHVRFSELCGDCLTVLLRDAVKLLEAEQIQRTI